MHYIVIAVFVSVSQTLLDQHVNALHYKPIALVQTAKCQMTQTTATKYAPGMGRANAINANATVHIWGSFVRVHLGMRHLIRCVSSTRRVFSAPLTENSATSA